MPTHTPLGKHAYLDLDMRSAGIKIQAPVTVLVNAQAETSLCMGTSWSEHAKFVYAQRHSFTIRSTCLSI